MELSYDDILPDHVITSWLDQLSTNTQQAIYNDLVTHEVGLTAQSERDYMKCSNNMNDVIRSIIWKSLDTVLFNHLTKHKNIGE